MQLSVGTSQILTHPVRSLCPPINVLYVETHSCNPLDEAQGPPPYPKHNHTPNLTITIDYSNIQAFMTTQFSHLRQQITAHHGAYTSLNDAFYRMKLTGKLVQVFVKCR
ncbi:unnamed protein product [Sphenostylis stenocarpa]|uniref:Uncharacterized protein n=1 Tax=Sphenostylis stenocarpa TaxID=92480 RepID=A0AA86VJF7_9FABA|nr:unnamed protein product [Sphenostylis stenocarpa]